MRSEGISPKRLKLVVSAAVIFIELALGAILWTWGFMSFLQAAVMAGLLMLLSLLIIEFFYRISLADWQKSQQYQQSLLTLRKSSLLISSSLYLDEVLQAILSSAAELAKVKMVNIMLIDPDSNSLVMRAHIGQPPEWVEAVRRNPIPVGKSLTGWVAEKGEILEVLDAPSDPRLLYQDLARRYGLISYLGIPLKFKGKVTGVLNVHTSEPYRFSPEEIEVLSGLADHAAVALQNARLHEEAERERGEVAALAEISQDISSSLQLPAILNKLVAHARQISHSDLAYIGLYDPVEEAIRVQTSIGYRTDFYKDLQVHRGKGAGGLVLETRKPFLTDDYRNDPRFHHEPTYDEIAKKEGVVSQLIVPILKEDRILGLMWVANRQPVAFTSQDQQLLQALATQATIAIENARLYEELRQRILEVEEKNRELLAAQEELVKAQRLAAIGELGLAVAHEINNPLATLLLQADFISGQSGDLPSHLQKSLKTMEAMIWRMKEIVDRLQDIRSERTRDAIGRLKMTDLRKETPPPNPKEASPSGN